MLILGLDPGTATTGYGIVEVAAGTDPRAVDYGVILTPAKTPLPERLLMLHTRLSDLLRRYQPQSAAVEKLFFQRNVTTAMSVGQARGVILLTLAQHGLEIGEYTPNEIKETVTGYGSAGKSQMQRMVQMLLHLERIPKPDDAADALAVALCHAQHHRWQTRLAGGRP